MRFFNGLFGNRVEEERIIALIGQAFFDSITISRFHVLEIAVNSVLSVTAHGFKPSLVFVQISNGQLAKRKRVGTVIFAQLIEGISYFVGVADLIFLFEL